jgi:hypothetical protein
MRFTQQLFGESLQEIKFLLLSTAAGTGLNRWVQGKKFEVKLDSTGRS